MSSAVVPSAAMDAATVCLTRSPRPAIPPRLSGGLWPIGGFILLVVCSPSGFADEFTLTEPFPDHRVFSNETRVTTQGKVLTSRIGGEKDELDLEATAAFEFRSRRLPPAGRDARALRDVREFAAGQVETTVGGRATTVRLPRNIRLIVAAADREGVLSYSPQAALTREVADLLEIPGDPLSLLALLPLESVKKGDEWTPPDWAVQLLTGIEAVETSKLTCRLDDGNSAGARVAFNGKIQGQRFGANTTVEVVGAYIFDLRTKHLSQARTIYKITADVGTVNPGLDVTVTANLTRRLEEAPGGLTDSVAESIPLNPPAEQLQIVFRAAPWGVELRHGRDWHLFQSVLEGQTPVAILRLVERGSLVCQCNVSPLPQAAAGQHVPLDQFEADVQQSLGKRFQKILAKERLPARDGGLLFRIVVEGEVELAGNKAAARVPMHWIYYLVADRQGRQASFVFSVEPALLEQLGGRDLEIVESLRFGPVAD